MSVELSKFIIILEAHDFDGIQLFAKNKAELSYSNKKEYLLWILTAKQEKTRNERLGKLTEKLVAGKKNPSEKCGLKRRWKYKGTKRFIGKIKVIFLRVLERVSVNLG